MRDRVFEGGRLGCRFISMQQCCPKFVPDVIAALGDDADLWFDQDPLPSPYRT